ncbi:hypothetical protein AHAS_Ahas13G0467400 [Arachis hypogaea]
MFLPWQSILIFDYFSCAKLKICQILNSANTTSDAAAFTSQTQTHFIFVSSGCSKEANEESKAVTKVSAMKAIKKRMEKDIDEVRRIEHGVKTKVEAVNRDVMR